MIWLHPLPFSRRKTEKERQLAHERDVGWGRSQIIGRRESRILYKSFNTLCGEGTADPPTKGIEQTVPLTVRCLEIIILIVKL
jgi:hypothetical protein